MSIKILTKNSIDNTNIDGARANHFSAGMRSGIVKGAYNEGTLFAPANNKIALDSCELRISGHQVIIDSVEQIELQNAPSQSTRMSVIAEIKVDDSSVPTFRLFVQNQNVSLIQDNLFKTNNGNGTYQLRIGNFTLGTTGIISDVVRTADIITGGGEGGVADIKFNATATQLSSSSQPDVNIDYNEETGEYDAHFGIPAGGGSRVTIGGVEQPTWSADPVYQLSNPNLLINGNFRVNQRGQTSYTESGYTVDRCKISTSSVGVTITPKTNGGINIKTEATTQFTGQRIFEYHFEDKDTELLKGKEVTFSAKISSIVSDCRVRIYMDSTIVTTQTINSAGLNYFSFTIPTSGTSLKVAILNNSGALNMDIDYWKLELGSVATANSPRPYAEELALCKRYFRNVYLRDLIPENAYATDWLLIRMFIDEMRIEPTMTQVNLISLKQKSSTGETDVTQSQAGSYFSYKSNKMITISARYFSNLVNGSVYWTTIFPDIIIYQLDAEIY